MNVYLKSLRLFLVLMVGVFFLVGSGGGGGGDKDVTSPEPITVLDTTTQTISQNEIKTILENNETTYTKSFTLDDKKTNVKISFDLVENNVTKDVQIDVENFDYKEDELTASILKLTSSTPLKNIDIEIEDIVKSNKNKTFSKINNNGKRYKIIVSSIGKEAVYEVYKSNFSTYIKNAQLEQVGSDSYKYLPKIKFKIS